MCLSMPYPSTFAFHYKIEEFEGICTYFSSYSSLILSVSSLPPSVNFIVNEQMEVSAICIGVVDNFKFHMTEQSGPVY